MSPKPPAPPLYTDSEVQIYKPDPSLQQKIGNIPIRELITPERIEIAQQEIFDARPLFIEGAWTDLQALANAFLSLPTGPSNANIELMKTLSLRMKGQAGTFGYDLLTKTAGSLYLFLEQNYQDREGQRTVIRTHLEAITALLQQNLIGTGGDDSAELLKGLRQLVEKYR